MAIPSTRISKYYPIVLVALLEVVFIVVVLALFCCYYANLGVEGAYKSAGFILPWIGATVALLIVIVMLIGVLKDKPMLLVPHLVAQIISIGLMVIFVTVTLLLLFVAKTDNVKSFYISEDFSVVYLTMAVLCCLMAIVEVFFFFVVKKFYEEIKLKREAAMLDEYQSENYRSEINKIWMDQWKWWMYTQQHTMPSSQYGSSQKKSKTPSINAETKKNSPSE